MDLRVKRELKTPIETDLKLLITTILFDFALEYTIRKVHETNLGVDMNGAH